MTAKMLLQDIWRSGTDWGDPLPPTLTAIWTSSANELQSIAQIKSPVFGPWRNPSCTKSMCVQTHRNLASVHVFIYALNTHPANSVSIFFLLKLESRHFINFLFPVWSCKVQCSVSGCVNQLSKNSGQLLPIPFSGVIPKLFSSGFIQSRADITHLWHTGSPKYSTAAPLHSGGIYQVNSIQRMTAPVVFQPPI